MNDPTTIAVGLAKSVFEIAVSHQPGRVAERRRLSRGQMSRFLAQCPPATVLVPSCKAPKGLRVSREEPRKLKLS